MVPGKSGGIVASARSIPTAAPSPQLRRRRRAATAWTVRRSATGPSRSGCR